VEVLSGPKLCQALNNRVTSLGCAKSCAAEVVIIELILFFTVDEKTIRDKAKEFEAAIAEAGGVEGKSIAGGNANLIHQLLKI
jgi:hypothetical protein